MRILGTLQNIIMITKHSSVIIIPCISCTECEMYQTLLQQMISVINKTNTLFILTKNTAQPPEDVLCLPLVHCQYKRSRD